MKNVMKKLFSLLLVGVIAVSMFSFVAPNSVDAAEAKPSKGTVYLKQNAKWSLILDGYYFVYFYDASGKLISNPATRIFVKHDARYPIPENATSVVVKVQKGDWLTGAIDKVLVGRLKFNLNEASTDSTGSINVLGHGSNVNAYTSQSTTGCWQYVGEVYHD